MSGTKRSAEGGAERAVRGAAADLTGSKAETWTKAGMAVTGKTASGAVAATTSGEAVGTCGDASAITGDGLAGLAGGVKYWTGAPAPWS